MIAEMLAMIGRDDHQSVVEHPAPAKLIEQDPQMTIEIENTIVVNIDGHLHMSLRDFRLVEGVPAFQSSSIEYETGRSPKPGIERSGTSYGECASL